MRPIKRSLATDKTQQTKAEGDAKAKVIAAEAEAKQKEIAVQAEAEANKKINESVTQTTIDYVLAQARKDKGWVTVQGSGATIVDQDKGK